MTNRHTTQLRLTRLALALAVLLGMLFAPLFGLAPLPTAQAASGDCIANGNQVAVCTYTFTGGAQSWSVPADVTSATFDVYGAQGGGSGGRGGRVTATLAVTPGAVYQLLVGGRNSFNGGGSPGGGGASDIRDGSFTLADRRLVAGGGGGGGEFSTGGAGGYPAGSAGADSAAGGGGGGTQTSGGAGGGGFGGTGQAGGLGQGGNASFTNLIGGGGGGGYYGGGAGGSAPFEDIGSGAGGAGGGGSSYATPAATSVSFQNGVRTGDGLITITYTDPVPPSVTINQATSQADPTTSNPVRFSAQFSEPVTGFTAADVSLSGTAALSGATVAVSGGPVNYEISVDGMAGTGTVIASLAANSASDFVGNGNTASTSTDNAVSVNFDTTGPLVTPTVAGTLGSNGWYTSDVSVSWSVVDNESGISSQSGCDTQNVTSDTAAATFTCSATSPGGSSSQDVTFKRDATAPTVSAAATTAPNASGWYNGPVTVAFTCADALSGVASCPAGQTLSADGSAVSSSAQTASDNAGNTSVPSNVVTVKLDTTAPSVGVIGVTNGASYSLGSVPAVACSTADALSGVATQATISVSGGNPDGTGSFSATCTGATDLAGNAAAPVSVSYTVGYRWSGFLQPVDNLPTINSVKAGSAVPVKFSLGGNYALNIFAAGYPKVQIVSCSSGAPTDEIEQTVTAGASGLSYDAATGQYSYTWKTDKSWAGSCRQLVVKLTDGTEHVAGFQFR